MRINWNTGWFCRGYRRHRTALPLGWRSTRPPKILNQYGVVNYIHQPITVEVQELQIAHQLNNRLPKIRFKGGMVVVVNYVIPVVVPAQLRAQIYGVG